MSIHNSILWGAPKKFATQVAERKISWLELFYDLVYVIVISRITHYLAVHPGWEGIMDYVYLFAMAFWGWYNGSQYHDLHGSPGIRTRFMTLWQMVVVAALAVTLGSPDELLLSRATFGFLILQGYVTYLWWSVGIYDKVHRKLNIPYTICYLIAFSLILSTLYIPQPYKRIVFWITLVFNYIPPFLMSALSGRTGKEFTQSLSMVERLGLFTIIVFGEVILGIINAIDTTGEFTVFMWLCFVLCILIVFALWWIFFALIADRACKSGLATGSAMAMLYIPTLASLGMLGATFPGIFSSSHEYVSNTADLHRIIHGVSIAIFLCSISAVSRYLVYPAEYQKSRRVLQPLLVALGMAHLCITLLFPQLPLIAYLLYVFICLFGIISYITRYWLGVEQGKLS